MYAATTVALRDLPWTQWTRTRGVATTSPTATDGALDAPPSLLPWLAPGRWCFCCLCSIVARCVVAKDRWDRMSSSGTSSRSMTWWDTPMWWYG